MLVSSHNASIRSCIRVQMNSYLQSCAHGLGAVRMIMIPSSHTQDCCSNSAVTNLLECALTTAARAPTRTEQTAQQGSLEPG